MSRTSISLPRECCRHWLESWMKCLSQSFEVPAIDRFVGTDRLGRGVHVAYGPTLKVQHDQLLTLYAIHKQFGEWESLLCCNKHTTLEQVSLLIAEECCMLAQVVVSAALHRSVVARIGIKFIRFELSVGDDCRVGGWMSCDCSV